MNNIQIENKHRKERFQDAAYLLKALSHETRLCIITQLSQVEEKTVSELMEESRCEQSLISHHLTDMRAKGILHCRRSGKNCYYSLKNKKIVKLLECIMECTSDKIF